MNRLTCGGCRFWDHPVWDTEGAAGPITMDCRRKAPAVTRPDDDSVGHNATWPRTKHTDWCGDAEPEPPEMEAARVKRREELAASPYGEFLRPSRAGKRKG